MIIRLTRPLFAATVKLKHPEDRDLSVSSVVGYYRYSLNSTHYDDDLLIMRKDDNTLELSHPKGRNAVLNITDLGNNEQVHSTIKNAFNTVLGDTVFE